MDILKNRFPIYLLSILIIVVQSGCTTTKHKASNSNASIQVDSTPLKLNVAVVPVNNMPQIKCIAYDKGRGRAASEGASKLGKEGAIGGLKLPFYALLQCNDPLAGALVFACLPVLVPACGLGGAVLGSSAGAIGGAIKGDYRENPMEEVGEMATFAGNVSAMIDLNTALAEQLTKTGLEMTNNNYTTTSIIDVNNDFDVIIKVGITSLMFKGEIARDPDIGFETIVKAEVTDPAESVSFSDIYNFESNEIRLSNWNKKKGQPLQKELSRCYQDISARIMNEMFILNEQFLIEFLSE